MLNQVKIKSNLLKINRAKFNNLTFFRFNKISKIKEDIIKYYYYTLNFICSFFFFYKYY